MNKIAEALRVAHRALSIMSFDACCNDADRQVTAAIPLAEAVLAVGLLVLSGIVSP